MILEVVTALYCGNNTLPVVKAVRLPYFRVIVPERSSLDVL